MGDELEVKLRLTYEEEEALFMIARAFDSIAKSLERIASSVEARPEA